MEGEVVELERHIQGLNRITVWKKGLLTKEEENSFI